MSQTVGKMNSNRPSLAGNKPGVSPGAAEQVRPPKLGQAQPGGPVARNSPSPNAQGNSYNKQAAPPKGAKKLPGAKGPGDPKVTSKGNGANTSQKTGRVTINVTASASAYDIAKGSSHRLETQLGLGTLRCAGAPMAKKLPMKPTGVKNQSTGLHAGPSSLSDKETGNTEHEVAYNPVMRSSGKCKKCGKKMSACTCKMQARGHSLGAKKGWSVRNKGHVSQKEKQGQYSTMG